jgi:hypothetical protein
MTPPPTGDIPESLIAQIREFRMRLFRTRACEALVVCPTIAAACYLVFFLSDRLWDTPGILAWACILPVFPGIPLYLFAWWLKWFRTERTPRQLASLLARSNPALGDRLLGVIDLASSAPDETVSPRLRQAAIVQNAQELAGKDFFSGRPRKPVITRVFLPVFLIVIAGSVFLAFPDAAGNAWRRWANPFHPPERFTFTVLEPLRTRLIVAQGESWPMEFLLSSASSHRPETAHFRLDGGTWNEIGLSPDKTGYRLTLPPLYQATRMEFSAGDTLHRLKIIPQPRPGMERAEAEITPPSYTGRPPYREPMKAGAIPVPEGSTADIRATATRPLLRASSSPDDRPIRIEGKTVTISGISMEREPQEWELSWTDTDGLQTSSPRHLTLTPVEDRPPRVLLHEDLDNKYILENTSIQISIEATDDYGIRETGISWVGEQSLGQSSSPGTSTERILKPGSPTTTSITEHMVFRAKDLGISPQRVVIRAFASDYSPHGKRVYSDPFILYILTPERHAEMIRHSLERLIGALEELSRSMDSIGDETKSILLADRKSDNKDLREKIPELVQQEQTNRRQLSDLLRQGEAIFREATLNTQIDPDGMKRLMDSIRQMSPLPAGTMRNAQKYFEQAAETVSPQEMESTLKQADREHEQAVEAIKTAIASMNAATKSMEAGTFVARLRHLSKQEESVSRSLASYLQTTVGLLPDELPPAAKRNMEAIDALQKATTRNLGWMLEDLASYRQRATHPIYGDLYEIMQNSEIVRRMENVSEYIASSQSGVGIEHALLLSRALEHWARLLDDSKKTSHATGGGSGMAGSGGGEISQSAFELTLKLMFMIRSQQDIRLRTRAMEEERREHPDQSRDTSGLAREQDELQADTMDIISEQTDRNVIALLEQCRHAMNDAVDELEANRTGGPAIAAQTEVIELIYQAALRMNGGDNRQEENAGTSTLMDMIRQMLGLETDSVHKKTSPSSSPGAGTGSSGTSPEGNTPMPDDDQAPVHKTRSVPKSTGSGVADMPEEFRKALDAYNKTLQE